MRLSLVALLSLLPSVALAQVPEPGPDAGHEEPQSIYNGREEPGFPAVVALGAEFNGNSFSACTGSLITPRMILSAAHCGADLPLDLVVALGSAFFGPNVDNPELVVGFEDLIVHPDYFAPPDGRANETENDVSILILEEEVWDVEPVWLHFDELDIFDDIGTELISVGFGSTSGAGGGSGVKRSADLVLSQFSQQFIVSNSSQNPDGANICGGDSGGPQFAWEDDRPVQWGVHSWGDQNCSVQSGSTRIDLLGEWILDQIEEVHGTRDLCEAQGRYDDGVCEDDICPDDIDCAPVGDDDDDDDSPPEGGCEGCAQSGAPARPAGSLGLLLLAGLWGWTRRPRG